jgi:hypothetical protein
VDIEEGYVKLVAFIPIAAAACAYVFVDVHAQTPRDYTKYNVCEAVPGDAIARAFSARLVSTRPTFDKKWSRCMYLLTSAEGSQPRGYVVWLSPAADFEEMKQYIEEKVAPVAGLGDGAYLFRDKGDGRFKMYVLMRGDQTIQVSGETAESARKVAETVLAVFRKRSF